MTESLFDFEHMNLAIMMSGSGSNAKKIIERYLDIRDKGEEPPFTPKLIITDNPDSNAVKIGSKDYLDRCFSVPVWCNSIFGFYRVRGLHDLKDRDIRGQFDYEQVKVLSEFGINCVALAGYDRIVTPQICNTFFTINVHPGDLRARDEDGNPRYAGLAWVPSAKAVLAGERKVHTSVHIVTPKVDDGTVLAVSTHIDVPAKVLSLENRAVLLGEGTSIQQISDILKANPDMPENVRRARFPLYGVASDLQNELKVKGDWVVFPQALEYLARHLYEKRNGRVYFYSQPVPVVIEK